MSINKLSVPPPEPRLISVTACAAMLDVSETTVRKLIRIGSLQAVHIVGCQRIKVASVETILNSGVSPAAMGRAEPDDFGRFLANPGARDHIAHTEASAANAGAVTQWGNSRRSL